MKLLTVNVHAWLEDNQQYKLQQLAAVIASKRYDIIALQEVNQSITSPCVYDDIRKDNYGLCLLEALKQLNCQEYSYHWTFSHIGYDRYEEGLALMTRHPVAEIEGFYCSRSSSAKSIASRKVLRLRLKLQDQLLDCYSCHMNLPSSEEDYLDNVRRLVEQNQSSYLKLFMGDFNTDAFSQTEQYQGIKSFGLYDSYELAQHKDSGITVSRSIDGWRSDSENKRLDYIFLNQKKEVLSSQVIFNQTNEAVISDHYGLEVVVKLNETKRV